MNTTRPQEPPFSLPTPICGPHLRHRPCRCGGAPVKRPTCPRHSGVALLSGLVWFKVAPERWAQLLGRKVLSIRVVRRRQLPVALHPPRGSCRGRGGPTALLPSSSSPRTWALPVGGPRSLRSSLSPSRRPGPHPLVLGCPGPAHAALLAPVWRLLSHLPQALPPHADQSSGQEVRKSRLEEVAVQSWGEAGGPWWRHGCPWGSQLPACQVEARPYQVWSPLGPAALPGCPAHRTFASAHACPCCDGRVPGQTAGPCMVGPPADRRLVSPARAGLLSGRGPWPTVSLVTGITG